MPVVRADRGVSVGVDVAREAEPVSTFLVQQPDGTFKEVAMVSGLPLSTSVWADRWVLPTWGLLKDPIQEMVEGEENADSED